MNPNLNERAQMKTNPICYVCRVEAKTDPIDTGVGVRHRACGPGSYVERIITQLGKGRLGRNIKPKAEWLKALAPETRRAYRKAGALK